MNIFDAVLLGLLQGLTEFLPVSSSGHLVVGQRWLGWAYEPEKHLLFDIVLHVGTLVAVMIVYRHSLVGLLRGSWDFLTRGGGLGERWRREPEARLVFWLALATVPTGLVGVLFKDSFERAFGSLQAVGWMFAVTGGILLLSLLRQEGEIVAAQMGPARALLLGLAQGMAIMPGISRSGTTIVCALLLGLKRDEAARFSFLLAIPAILGAVVLQLRKVSWSHLEGMPLLLGGLTAALSGFLALLLLLRLVRQGRLAWFTLYLWPLAVAVLLWNGFFR